MRTNHCAPSSRKPTRVLALYAELDTQAEQLRQASELKSRFLSYMSHEFRTPLGSILSTRLLSDELMPPSPEQHKQVRFVSSAASELSEMVDDLLDLAKIEAGRVSISPAWFDMLDLFSALRGMFRPIVEGSPVDLISKNRRGCRASTPTTRSSRRFCNFISNALKFTTQGKCVSRHGWRPPAGALRGHRHRHRHRTRAARSPVRGLRPGRFSLLEAPARHGSGTRPVQNASPSCWAVGLACRASPARVRVLRDHPVQHRAGGQQWGVKAVC